MNVVHANLFNYYRPKTFSEVVGQRVIVQVLVNSINQQQIAHAYLFAGPRGTGKTSVARIFAKALNCHNWNGHDLCNQCASCQLINQQKTADVVEVDAASNNGVEHIRELSEHAQYLPLDGQYKVYIIDEAHMLTNSAWNALLKILEEPPKHLVFIFSTTEIHKILPTILSRCQKHYFGLLTQSLIRHHLSVIAQNEGVELSAGAQRKLSQLAHGSLRDGLNLLGQMLAYQQDQVDEAIINEVLSLVDFQQLLKFLINVINYEVAASYHQLKTFYHQGKQLQQLWWDLLAIIIDFIVYQQTQDPQLLTSVSAEELAPLLTWNGDVRSYINVIEKIINQLKQAPDGLMISQIGLTQLLALSSKVNTTPNNVSELAADVVEEQPVEFIPKRIQADQKKNQAVTQKPKVAHATNTPWTPPPYQHDHSLFQTSTLHVNNPQIRDLLLNNHVSEVSPEPPPTPVATNEQSWKSTDNLGLYTLAHANKVVSNHLEQQLTQLKNAAPWNSLLAQQILTIASDLSVILVFSDPTSALEFNDWISVHQNLALINKQCATRCYWIGAVVLQLKSWKQQLPNHHYLVPEAYQEESEPTVFAQVVEALKSS